MFPDRFQRPPHTAPDGAKPGPRQLRNLLLGGYSRRALCRTRTGDPFLTMAVCLLRGRPRQAPKCAQIRPKTTARQITAAGSNVRQPQLPTRYPGRAYVHVRSADRLGAHAAVQQCAEARPKLMGGFLQACASRQAVAARSGLREHQRSATHAAALEAPDWGIETDRRRSVVELDYRPVEAGQVPRADAVTDADAISDAGRREHVAHSIMWNSRLHASTADAIAVR